MKKHFTLEEKSKHRVSNSSRDENPSKKTVDFIMQFARVYSVEKAKNGSKIELILN